MDILKHELYKIFSRKAQMVTFFALLAGYVYATQSYYKWYTSTSWERIIAFPGETGALFIAALVLIAIAPVFTEEYTLKTHVLIMCTKRGQKDVAVAKLAASSIYALAACTAFFAFNAAVNIAYAGLKGWNKPLNALYQYAAGPLRVNLLGYFIIEFLLCAAGSVAFTVFVLYLSALNKSILNVLFIGGILFVIPYFLEGAPEYFIVKLLKDFSYTALMRVYSFFTVHGVYTLLLVIAFIAAVTVLLIKRLLLCIKRWNLSDNNK